MDFTQPTGMKMTKSWPNRSNIPVCGMQTTANLNQCGIEGMARLPKSRKEKAPARGERSERKIKASCLCRAEKAESEENHTAWPSTAHCDGKVSAQAFFGQYAAKRKGTRWFVGLKSRRLATSILPHGKRSR